MKSRREQVRNTIQKLLEFVSGVESMPIDPISSSNYNATPAARTLASYGYNNLMGGDKKGKYFKEIPTKGSKKKNNKNHKKKRRLM